MSELKFNLLAVAEDLLDATELPETSRETVVYMAVNENTDQYYIGATVDNIRRRKVHLNKLKKNCHSNPQLQEAFNADPNFKWKELKMETQKIALELERELIEACKDDSNCLNLQHVVPKSAETIEKIRLGCIAFYENNPEARERSKEKSIELWSDPEKRELQSVKRKQFFENGGYKYRLGKTISNELKEKLFNGRDNYFNNLTEEEKININKIKTEHLKKPVKIDGILYESRDAAAAAHGVSSPTVRDRINSKNFINWEWG